MALDRAVSDIRESGLPRWTKNSLISKLFNLRHYYKCSEVEEYFLLWLEAMAFIKVFMRVSGLVEDGGNQCVTRSDTKISKEDTLVSLISHINWSAGFPQLTYYFV